MPNPCEMELTSSSFMKLPSMRSVGSGFRCLTRSISASTPTKPRLQLDRSSVKLTASALSGRCVSASPKATPPVAPILRLDRRLRLVSVVLSATPDASISAPASPMLLPVRSKLCSVRLCASAAASCEHKRYITHVR